MQTLQLSQRLNGPHQCSEPIRFHPNPTNSHATIQYELKNPQPVSIRIYNQLGVEVDRIDANQSAGTQRVTWDASEMPSGVYFYSIEAGKDVMTGKVMVAR